MQLRCPFRARSITDSFTPGVAWGSELRCPFGAKKSDTLRTKSSPKICFHLRQFAVQVWLRPKTALSPMLPIGPITPPAQPAPSTSPERPAALSSNRPRVARSRRDSPSEDAPEKWRGSLYLRLGNRLLSLWCILEVIESSEQQSANHLVSDEIGLLTHQGKVLWGLSGGSCVPA